MSDGETLSALQAEVHALREHARRAAPGRHQRPPLPRGWRRPRPLDNFWQGGYVSAMHQIGLLVADEAARTHSPEEVLLSVIEAVLAAEELHQADTVPAAWLSDSEDRP